jgi:hypothetical protein
MNDKKKLNNYKSCLAKKYKWDVPFEIRHGLRLMVSDFLDFFLMLYFDYCYE